MPTHQYSESDLSARARIRDAALEQFALHGTSGATMRGIAQAAGVSVGLVQHHFGTKDGLRLACDELVVEVFRRRVLHLAKKDQLADADALGELFDESPLLLRYLARASLDGSAAADEVFDQLADGTQDFLTETWPDRFPEGSGDARDTATVMTAMHSGIALLIGQVARRFGQEPEEAIGSARVAMGIMNLYAAMGEFAQSTTGKDVRAAVEDRGSGADRRRTRPEEAR
ncbi:TetR/AcrR family transcriptional regulator [Promicromonospora vindobonensis]|uniref:TetR/AcrR family transcriptional regulator n=1 Tax=Promicromonospora vindobonensis TaxID=195748 RepID=A0ABW5VYU8_9MICO